MKGIILAGGAGTRKKIAYRNGWIDKNVLLKTAAEYKTEYGAYLRYIGERA